MKIKGANKANRVGVKTAGSSYTARKQDDNLAKKSTELSL